MITLLFISKGYIFFTLHFFPRITFGFDVSKIVKRFGRKLEVEQISN